MGVGFKRSSRTIPPAGPSRDEAARIGIESAIVATSESVPLRTRFFVPGVGQPVVAAGESPLAAIHFSPEPVTDIGPYPVVQVSMTSLDGNPRSEVWSSDLPVQYGVSGGIHYAADGEVLFGAISDPVTIAGSAFEDRVYAVYDALFALAESQGYPHLLRVWNYFPGINAGYGGLENYRRFCRARAGAFQDRFGDFVSLLPSASAIGVEHGPLVIYFVAARGPGLHRENPRQLSAYSYPSQYGPRSPSFARATLKRFGEREIFFISGTASIVGHESMHRGDVRGQLEETLRNIEALIDSTHRDESVRFRGLTDIGHMKVYLRHPADLPLVRDIVRKRVGEAADVLYLHGEVCRSELLVEIEAVIDS